jgi:anti-sigma factor RsiW
METAPCGWVRRFLGPWKDGELDPADSARIESHIASCSTCAEQARFERWFSGEVRRLADRPQAPARLADRISLDLRREQRRQRVRRGALAFGGLAAAAGLAAVAAFALSGSPPATSSADGRGAVARELGAGGVPPSTPSAPPGFLLASEQDGEAVGTDLVNRHERAVGHALPLELVTDDADAVSAWFQGKVDFRVVPPRFSDTGIRLVGGRLTHVRDQDAAYLGYDVLGHPLSLLVVAAGRLPFGGERVYSVGGRNVFVSHRDGLNYAVLSRNGLVYALVSDLDGATLVGLAAQVP